VLEALGGRVEVDVEARPAVEVEMRDEGRAERGLDLQKAVSEKGRRDYFFYLVTCLP